MQRSIFIVSEDLVAPWDEGIKKFTVSIGRALAPDHAVRIVNVDRSGLAAARNGGGRGDDEIRNLPGSRTFASGALRRELRAANPDVVIYVPSPSDTVSSILRARVLRVHAPRARIGMVALIPRRHGRSLRPLLRRAAPDRIFVPSYASLLHLCDLGLPGGILPIGVDLATFSPVAGDDKRRLRREHGIPEDAFVYLHVGHLTPKRNLAVLARLAALPGAYVIAIGSTSTPEDTRLRNDLEAAGVRVIREFVPVHEYYRMVDAYVFPTIDSEGCVEIPLSVFEALASGVPVLARAFGGLRDFIPAGDDVRYFDDDDALMAHATALQAGPAPAVRAMDPFGWRRVAGQLLTELMGETGDQS
ncbi:MAG TPA: glycosyltransferase family 4 protein [Candidatus Krumholzibacteria bacterium]|nr:glycosyltransferase family 4 protein [Candidatus Krumholzibacteria bacterium]